jgi:DivIVA domain-containing protein
LSHRPAKEEKVDQDSVERIRSATFNVSRRGYDRREVDTFLQRLADWLEGGGEEQAHSELVQRELERIGQRTAKVLTAAGEAAAALTADAEAEASRRFDEARIAANAARVEAERYAEQTRSEVDAYAEAERGKADAYAQKVRQATDEYDQGTRTEADAYAGQTREEVEALAAETREEAEAESKRLVNDAKTEAARVLGDVRGQRKDLDTVIADLVERRDQLLDELERIAGSLAGTASEHRHPEPPTERLSTDGSEQEPASEKTGDAPARRKASAKKG